MATIRRIGDSHEIAARWFWRLAEGDASDQDKRAFQAWLEADEANRRNFHSVAETWSAMDSLIAEHQHEMHAMVLQDTNDVLRQQRVNLRRRGFLAASIAAFAATVIGGGAWYANLPSSYSTGLSERRTFRLADGSTIALDANTRVRVRFSEDERKLWLDAGRARFNVAHDPLKPFSVTAGDRVVVATGTSFSVEQLSNQVRVLLYEGSVVVVNKGASTKSAQYVTTTSRTLAAGQELVLDDGKALAKASTETPDLSQSSSWEDGLLSFDAVPLTTAVERVNRYSDRQIRVDPSATDVRVSGVFKDDDSRGFVEGVTAVLPVTAREQGNVIVLTAKP
ncbi:MAG: FecR domain-containing protein [Proteobacteria bacterium]|nr:FecR domain-containing protein [Pseudomonadota bacterium]